MPEVDTYWGREVVLKNVPVEYPLREQRARSEQTRRRLDTIAEAARSSPSSPPPPPIPTTLPAGIADEMERLKKLQVGLRDKLLAVPGEDFARYQDLLKQPATGLIKLLPREKYGDAGVGMRGGGAYFSFVRKTHEYGYGSDIQLGDDGRFTVGFAGGDYGYFLLLGNVAMEDVAAATAAVPKWANGALAGAWADLWGTTPVTRDEISRAESDAFMRDAAAGRPGATARGVPATVGQSYLLRSVALDEYDILVGLRVVRKFDDDSVVVAYKLLRNFAVPRDPRDRGRPPRPPRQLPATRMP
jgi:hypothetical protein